VGRALAELARLGQAKPAEAYAAFDAAVRLDPGNAYTYVDACRGALRLNDAERHQRYLDQGLRLYPTFGLLREQAAMHLLLINRWDIAWCAFEAAWQADWKCHINEFTRFVAIFEEYKRRLAIVESQAKSATLN
jgi:hypothetical protein